MPPSKLVFYHVKQPIHPHQCTLHVWLSLCLKAQASFLFSPLCQPLPLLLPLPKISTVLFVLSLDRKPLHGGGQTAVGVQCCGVCVCVCVWEEKKPKGKKRCFLLPPLVFAYFMDFLLSLPSLPAHLVRAGSQGAEEAEGGGPAKARRRRHLGLLAGTQGTRLAGPRWPAAHLTASLTTLYNITINGCLPPPPPLPP